MPCDTIQVNRIDLPTMNPELLDAALKELGLSGVTRYGQSYSFTFEGNRYTLRAGELESETASDAELSSVRNMIARGYSAQVIGLAARKNNWSLRKLAPNRYQATRG